jgi:hypothetical protein
MKKVQFVIAIFIISYTSIYGQNYSKEFGKIGKEELELKKYSRDKEAEAIVLYDMAKSYFYRMENTFDVVFERKTRIKILSEAGIKWAEVEIPIYKEGDIYEEIFDIEAYTYNFENGVIKKLKLDVSNTYTEKLNKYWYVKKIALPNVKVGSIIEYRYKINSQYLFNLRDWEFQWKIPVVYSEYQVRMVPFYEYTFLLQGADKFDSHSSVIDRGISRHYGSITYQDVVNKFVMKDVPAFKSEDFITSINDYIIKLDFQLSRIIYPEGGIVEIMTTWEKMIKELSKHKKFGKYVKRSKKLTSKLIKKEIEKIETESEKFNFVLDYVKRNYKWDGSYGKYASKTPKKLTKEKLGNCADINLFTIGLLNGVGIKATPVIISTRNNGKIKYNYPFSKLFNYVLIYANVDGENILSDATEIYSLNNRIPTKCINEKGLIVGKDNVEWVNLEVKFPSEIKTDFEIKFENDKTFITHISQTSTEYDALYYRKHYTNNIKTIKKKIASDKYNIIDSSLTVLNQFDKEKPYILNYSLSSKPEYINGKIYMSPFPNEAITDNPLKQKKRSYDIDMIYTKKRSFNSTISIPEGYKIDYLPKELKISNIVFDLNYTIKQDKNNINVSLNYYFKNPIYSSRNYSNIKSYFDKIVNKGSEKIVFIKK